MDGESGSRERWGVKKRLVNIGNVMPCSIFIGETGGNHGLGCVPGRCILGTTPIAATAERMAASLKGAWWTEAIFGPARSTEGAPEPAEISMFSHLSWFEVQRCIITSSTAQGGGGSFKNMKPRAQVGCCDSRMAERIH